MPRPHKCRRIAAEPPVSAFKPAGIPGRELESIELGLDELEALRLADLEGLYHEAAAERMGISRPTFGRLVESARHKVASALFQSKMLIFTGGPVMVVNQRTFACAACGTRFQEPYGTGRPAACPQCQSTNFQRVADECGGAGCAGLGDGTGRGRCRRNRGGRPFAAGRQVSGAAEPAAAPENEKEINE